MSNIDMSEQWQEKIKVTRVGDHVVVHTIGPISLDCQTAVALAIDIMHAAGTDMQVDRRALDRLLKAEVKKQRKERKA